MTGLAHDPYTARVMAAHTREKLVYTLGFAEQFAAAKARARVGGGEVGDADVFCLMERLWGVYVPTCVDHADALLASVLPVNLSAANLSFEVPSLRVFACVCVWLRVSGAGERVSHGVSLSLGTLVMYAKSI